MVMANSDQWYVRDAGGSVYGPANLDLLQTWVREGRVEPTGHISQDRISWTPPQLLPELEMKWLVESAPGKIFGPFHRELVIRLQRDGLLGDGAKVYRLYELPVDQDPEPVIVEKIVEKIVEVEPPPRTTVIVPEVVEASAAEPPPVRGSGIFKGLDAARLAELESAARRELSAAKSHGFKFFGGSK